MSHKYLLWSAFDTDLKFLFAAGSERSMPSRILIKLSPLALGKPAQSQAILKFCTLDHFCVRWEYFCGLNYLKNIPNMPLEMATTTIFNFFSCYELFLFTFCFSYFFLVYSLPPNDPLSNFFRYLVKFQCNFNFTLDWFEDVIPSFFLCHFCAIFSVDFISTKVNIFRLCFYFSINCSTRENVFFYWNLRDQRQPINWANKYFFSSWVAKQN